MATIQEVLTIVDETPNSFTDTQKIGWLNELEGHIKATMIKKNSLFSIKLEKGKAEYNLPKIPFIELEEGEEDTRHQLDFLDIVNVKHKGRNLTNADISRPVQGMFYYGHDNVIIFHPVPHDTDIEPSINIVFEEPFIPYYYPEDKDIKLIAPPPFDAIYSQFCLAKIDWHNREYDNYNNTMALYNSTMESFQDWYKRRNPIPRSVSKNYW